MKPNAILETCLYVDDLEAAETFYRDVLGLEFLCRQEGRHAFFRCGQHMLLLFNPETTDHPDSVTPPHGAHGASHLAFAVSDDQIDAWQSHLEAHGVSVEKVIRWPQGGMSVYFRDPAGNSLEVATPRIWAQVLQQSSRGT